MDSAGGLTLPSPTSVHHNVSAAVRNLRRSLSRSPSKFALIRSASDSSDNSFNSSTSPSPKWSYTEPKQKQQQSVASPLSFSYATSTSLPNHSQTTPTSTPFRSKFPLRTSRPKAASAKPATRSRLQPRSPLKRALSSTNDIGNTVPPASSPESLVGQENMSSFNLQLAQTGRSALNQPKTGSRHSVHLDLTGASRGTSSPASRVLDVKSETYPTSTVSPLKRSDLQMNPDSLAATPVAKRRSLHGIASLGPDFNILDHAPPARSYFEIHDDVNPNPEYKLSGSALSTTTNAAPPSPTPTSSIPKRSSSLRKSTLSQRTSWGRRQGERFLAAQQTLEASTPVQRSKQHRASLDQFMQPDARDHLFTSRPSLSNSSAHFPPVHQPHPLSRILTTSSSTSTVGEESPTHFAIPAPERTRFQTQTNFARSLPVGARPLMATPAAYKSARPDQGAFAASTSLVSKVNRNPDFGQKKDVMPDTPCKEKKMTYPHNTYPPSSGSARKQSPFLEKGANPFNPESPSFGLGNSERSSRGLFNRSNTRKSSLQTSLLSFDPDYESLTSLDADLPPTPTKGSVAGKSASAGALFSSTPVASTRRFNASSSTFANGTIGRARTNSTPMRQWGSSTPKTPQELVVPPDASRLSISNHHEVSRHLTSNPPATPTTTFGRSSIFDYGIRRAHTPVNGHAAEIDSSLASKFTKIESVGDGEFSQVFRVRSGSTALFTPSRLMGTPPSPDTGKFYAVKKLKARFMGVKDKESKMREVSVLQALRGRDNILQYVDHWDVDSTLYIQTEFCDQGSLEKFTAENGFVARLDDYRIWKIVLEIAQGLNSIHAAGFIHLDLKPANIFIDFQGVLKIGDFGMTTTWPASKGSEIEGDRRYMASEAMQGHVDKSADIFSLGLIMLEVATNCELPENGMMWVAMREGDFSGVQSLTSPETLLLKRDDEGKAHPAGTPLGTPRQAPHQDYSFQPTHNPSNLFGTPKRAPEPKQELDAPNFMRSAEHPGSLDCLAKWMLQPEPRNRPTVDEILRFSSIQFVSTYRALPAAMYEGNWGPRGQSQIDSETANIDVEMTDAF